MMLSIITVNLNNSMGLEQTIDSVRSQSVKGFEFLIIDGDSTDDSLKVIAKNAQDISFWISEPDNGVYNAMNKGIAKASGKYLIFLNSGDCFSDTETVKKCYDFITKQPGADIYYGDIFVVNDINKPTKWLRTHPDTLSLEFLRNDNINHQASLIKADLFQEFGLYPEQYKIASDYWLFLKCFLYKKSFRHFGFPMVEYDLNGLSFSNYEFYSFEKRLIWRNLVPPLIEEKADKCEAYKKKLQHLNNYKIVSTAIFLNSKYQIIKKWFMLN